MRAVSGNRPHHLSFSSWDWALLLMASKKEVPFASGSLGWCCSTQGRIVFGMILMDLGFPSSVDDACDDVLVIGGSWTEGDWGPLHRGGQGI